MIKSELLKGLSIEELQERNEFTAIAEDSACCENCCREIVIKPYVQ